MASTFKRLTPPSSSRIVSEPAAVVANDLESSSLGPTPKGEGGNVTFLPGTKPWTSGITLTSTGLRDLDNILSSSGQPLGTCIWLEEDRWTNHLARSLVQYWCAEALCQGQELVCPVDDDDEPRDNEDASLKSSWISTTFDAKDVCSFRNMPSKASAVRELLLSMPRNLNKDKEDNKKELSVQQQLQLQRLDIVEEADDEEDVADEKLEIAWQYSKAVQQKRSGLCPSNFNESSTTMKNIQSNQDVFCHSYDLSGRLNDQMDVIEMSRIFQIVSSPLVANPVLHERQHGLQFYQNLILQLEGIFSTKSNCVVRVLFYRPTNIPVFTVALPMFMSYVRSRKLPVVVMVSVQPWTCTASTIPLQRCCDAVLLVESFASRREYPPPAEFRMLNGLLHIKKVSTVTTSLGHFADFTVTKRPAAYLFGLKRDRRKLHIQLLHIPPEDYAAGGGSVGGGGVRSGAGRSSSGNSIPSRTTTTKATTTGFGCASNVGSGNSPMDF